MNEPVVSILMPVKNTGKYTHTAIQSILHQTYRHFDLLILDSSDDNITTEIIKHFTDSRIKYFYHPEMNLPAILNFGLSIAEGEFIARMDSDDISLPERLSVEVDYLISHPETDIVGTQFYYIDEYNKILFRKNLPVTHDEIEFMMPIITSIHHPTILTRKDNFYKAGLYNEGRIYSEDTELYLRMLKIGMKFHNIDSPLYLYRIMPKSYELFEKQNAIKYKDCLDYINSFYKEDCFYYNIRRGLLEYYIGDISLARRYLLRSMNFDFLKSMHYLRYMVASLFGNKFLKFLRKHGISKIYNLLSIKIIHHDTYKVRS